MIRPHVTLGKRALRLACCATLAAASLAATSAAHAVVISVDFSSNALSTVPFNVDGLYLNLVTGAASATFATGYDINPYFAGSATSTPSFRLLSPTTGGGIVGVSGVATPLTVGASVGSSSAFITGTAAATFASSGTGYFGIRFLNEATGATNYGYLTVSESLPIAAGSVRVLAYAYENTGAAITVSAVPEPSGYLMMALGLAGVGAMARRRGAGR